MTEYIRTCLFNSDEDRLGGLRLALGQVWQLIHQGGARLFQEVLILEFLGRCLVRL